MYGKRPKIRFYHGFSKAGFGHASLFFLSPWTLKIEYTLNKIKDIETFGAIKLGSNAFITAPGRYRKVGEKWMKDSIKFAGRIHHPGKSRPKKTKKVRSH